MKLNGLKYKNMKRGRHSNNNNKTYSSLHIKHLKLFHPYINQRDIDTYYSQSSKVFDLLNDNKKNDSEKITEIENMITDASIEDVLDDVFRYKNNRILISHFILRYNKQFYSFVERLSLVDISRLHYLSDEDKIHCFELKERTMHDIEMAWRECIRAAYSPMIAKWCIKYHIGKAIPVDIFSQIFIQNTHPTINFIEMFLEYNQCDPTCILQWTLNTNNIRLLLIVLNHKLFDAKSKLYNLNPTFFSNTAALIPLTA